MNLPQFQLVVPAPDNPYFAGLAAQCKDEKILSIDYLPADCFKKAKAEAADPQNQEVVGELKSELEAYFKDPKSADFRKLPLCYSMLPQRMENYDVKLDSDECIKVLEQVYTYSDSYGDVCTYSDIAEQIHWDYREGARDVGKACSVSLFAIVVPCFRVVKTGPCLGQLGNNPYLEFELKSKGLDGWDAGRQIKRWLIEEHEKGWKVDATDGKFNAIEEWVPSRNAKLFRQNASRTGD